MACRACFARLRIGCLVLTCSPVIFSFSLDRFVYGMVYEVVKQPAFYQLFDEGIFVDKNYCVDMKNTVIICTSNFISEEEARGVLGAPLFARISDYVARPQRGRGYGREKRIFFIFEKFK